MKIFLKSLAALLFLALSIWAIRSDSLDQPGSVSPVSAGEVNATKGGPPAGDPAWRRDLLWDDGKTELCAYDVTWEHQGRTYDGRALLIQGDRSMPRPAAALPEDDLPAFLRGYVTGKVPAELTVFPSLMQSRLPDLKPAVWKVERRSVERGIEIRLSRGGESMAYTFDARAPHRLLRLDRSDGTVYSLAKCDRIASWGMHDPGDAAWLPEAAR
ncbi:MAG TPA: hypothetical protein VH394_20785 [Thermoanaerobaculia bacterium]|jgi:hypothetical protein|nr:hypothetical protein [Thermoanaerobaculia bacterium]